MLFRAEYLSLVKSRFRFRRWCYVLVFSGLFLLFLVLVILGRTLDHLFFGAFRRQKVTRPTFIIAPPRSGTTLLQNLLSLDAQRFVHLKMYQTIFPSVFYQRFIHLGIWVDNKLGGVCRKVLGWCEKKWFGGWDGLHKMRLNQPEEDDALFLYAFQSEAIYLLFPFINELWEAAFPDSLSHSRRRRLMGYYRSCLQRHLYCNGSEKILLSKATQSSGSVEGLLEEFPDARFITIVRDPYRSVASHVSLFVPIWQTHSPEIAKDGPEAKAYANLAIQWYKHLFAFRAQVDPRQYYCVDYRELARNPLETIEKLYSHFGWSITEEFRNELEKATRRQREFKSRHEYTLEEFGLSKEWIGQELADVLKAYDLESPVAVPDSHEHAQSLEQVQASPTAAIKN